MNCIDLHIHTTASDGTDPPRAAVEKATSLGLAAVSITDHDSVSGVPEAMRAGAELGVEVVPGIEVSSDYRDNNVHILGYFIDPAAPQLRPEHSPLKLARRSALISSGTSEAMPTTCSAAQPISAAISWNLEAGAPHCGHFAGAASPSYT